MTEQYAVCHYCNAPAVKLCDHIIGFTSDTGTVSAASKMITCSRPLCDECATQEGVIFFTGGFETVDKCPDHVGSTERMNPSPLKTLIAEKRRLQFKMVHNVN